MVGPIVVAGGEVLWGIAEWTAPEWAPAAASYAGTAIGAALAGAGLAEVTKPGPVAFAPPTRWSQNPVGICRPDSASGGPGDDPEGPIEVDLLRPVLFAEGLQRARDVQNRADEICDENPDLTFEDCLALAEEELQTTAQTTQALPFAPLIDGTVEQASSGARKEAAPRVADPAHAFLNADSFDEAFGYQPSVGARGVFDYRINAGGDENTPGNRLALQLIPHWKSLDQAKREGVLYQLNEAFVQALNNGYFRGGLSPVFNYDIAVNVLRGLLVHATPEVLDEIIQMIGHETSQYNFRFAQAIEDVQTGYFPQKHFAVPVQVQAWQKYNLETVLEYKERISTLPRDCQSWRTQTPDGFATVFNDQILKNPQNYNTFLAMLLQTAGNAKLPEDTRAQAQAYLDKFYPQHRAYQEWKTQNLKPK